MMNSMMKRVIGMWIAGALAVSCTACGGGGKVQPAAGETETSSEAAAKAKEDSSAGTDAKFEKMELNFSTSTSPTEAPAEGLEKMKAYIEEATDGQVTVNIHLQSALFTQEQEIPAIMKGNLEMCFSEAPWLVDYMPELSMYGSAYLFSSYDHWEKFYSSELAGKMFDNVADTIGVRPLGTVYLGARLINLTEDRQVLSRKDLKNVKLRMPSTDAWLFLGEALGANPVPVGYADLYLALQTGTVDGQDNPLPAIKNKSFYEVTKSVTMTNHVYGTNWVMISDKLWKSMSPELQEIVQKGVDIAAEYTNSTNRQLESELIPWLEEQGMTVYQPTTEELSAYRQEVTDYYLSHKEVVGGWDMEMYQKIQDMQ